MLCKGTCGRIMVPRRRWYRIPLSERRGMRRTHAYGESRGLCSRCYRIIREAGELIDYERLTMPLDVVLEEWAELADPHESLNANVRQLAPRLGMTEAALMRAIQRHRARQRVAA